MDKILRGAAKYNRFGKAQYLATLGRELEPRAVFITCIDRRLYPSEIINSEVGEIFYIRNAGNMVPHYEEHIAGNVNTEGAGLELGCAVGNIRSVIVCGHSDCKAINALYDMRHHCEHKLYHQHSPLKTWIAFGGHRTAVKFNELFSEEKTAQLEKEPLTFSVNLGQRQIHSVIDPDKQFCIQDKFSQINTLEQASHVQTYPFLQPLIKSGQLQVHAMWFDVLSGDLHMFSPSRGKFILLDDAGVNVLLEELRI